MSHETREPTSSSPEPLRSPAPSGGSDMDRQLAALRELLQAAREVQAQSARDALIEETLNEIRATAEAALVPRASVERTREHEARYPREHSGRDCGCSPCECVSEGCCCFDIIMTNVRVVQMQIEPADSNVNPLGEMEIRMFASIDEPPFLGAVIPDLFSYITIHKLLFEEGVWQAVNRVIGRKCISKRTPVTVPLRVHAVEVEHQEPLAMRDEYGTATGSLTLDCCCTTITPTTTFELSFTGGGQGQGKIACQFIAQRVC